jgi:hypothetical protein
VISRYSSRAINAARAAETAGRRGNKEGNSLMHRKILVAALAVLGVALVASPAIAKGPHRYSPRHGAKCKKSYRQVKHHGKRFCVKRAAKKKATIPVPERVKLHAHLDPSFTRNPLNPFQVTYAYSASATQESLGAVASLVEPAPLPAGVLALYSDGKLECAINVGAGIEGSECPVSYQALGEHRVTTIYSSGEQSATETEVENIGPLATTTTLSVSYEPFTRSLDTFGCGEGSTCLIEEGWHENGGFEIGILHIHGGVSPFGVAPVSACGSTASCRPLILDASGNASFPVSVIANWIAHEERVVDVGETIELEPEAIKHVEVGGILSEVPLSEVESGAFYFRVVSPSRAGYIFSEATTPIQFSPQVINPVERIPLG